MKNIKIFSTYNKGATINRVNAFAKVFAKFHNVEVVYLKSKEEESIDLKSDQLKYTPVEWGGATPKNFLYRFISEVLLTIKLKSYLNGKEDVVLLTIPFIPLSLLAFFCKKKTHLIMDFRDLTWEYLSDQGIHKLAKKLFRKLVKLSVRKSDTITVTNVHEYNWFLDNTKLKPYILSNGISEDQFSNLEKIEFRLNLQEFPIKIFYIGNVGLAQNLKGVISVISKLRKFQFNIVGGGNDLENIKEYIESSKIENTNLIGRVSPEKVYNYLDEADILLARLDENYTSAVPSKLYEYLATNKPIIFSGKGASIDLLSNFDNIFVYKNQKELENTLKSIMNLSKFETSKNRKLIESSFIREKVIEENLKYILP